MLAVYTVYCERGSNHAGGDGRLTDISQYRYQYDDIYYIASNEERVEVKHKKANI